MLALRHVFSHERAIQTQASRQAAPEYITQTLSSRKIKKYKNCHTRASQHLSTSVINAWNGQPGEEAEPTACLQELAARSELLSSTPNNPSSFSPPPKPSAPSPTAPHLSRRHRRRPPSRWLRGGELSGRSPPAAGPAPLMPRCLRP